MKRTTNLLVLIFFLLLTLCFTWPVVLHMKTAVKSAGDPLLNTWILAWDVHQLLTSPGELFEANIFHPHPHTLAYSEHLLASSLIAMPFILIWKSPVLGYNIVFLFSFVFAGWGMYLLIRDITIPPTPLIKGGLRGDYLLTRGGREDRGGIKGGMSLIGAVIGGTIFAFCPFRFSHLSHLHLLTIQWLPFTFLYFHRFIRTNSRRNLFLFAAFFLLLAFSSLHYALFASIALFLAFIFFLRKRHILKLALFAFVSAAVLFPVARIYLEVQKDMSFVRPIDEVEYYSASIRNYLAAPGGNMLYGAITRRFSGPEKELFPGIIALVLSVFGFSAVLGRGDHEIASLTVFPRNDMRFTMVLPLRRIIWFYLTLGIVCLLFSLGPSFPLYRFCYYHFPGFRGLRVPARFAVMVVFSLSVLSGFGVAKIISGRKLIPLMLIVPALLLEYWSGPISLYRVSREIPEVYQWIAGREENTVIVELPMPGSVESVHHETRYMYWSTFHWKRLVNGYSGFFPSSYWSLNKTLQGFPSASSLSMLESLGVDYIIVHTGKFRNRVEVRNELRNSERLVLEGTFGTNRVYKIIKNDGSSIGQADYETLQ